MKKRKWLNRNVAAMGFGSLFSDASHEMATATLPPFLMELVGAATAPQLLGLITGLSDASSSFVKTFSGWLSDKLRKRKPLVTLGYFLTGIFVGLTAFARDWFEVLIYRVLAWIGRGTREPPRDALLADSVDKKYYGHAFGFHRAMDTLGAIIGPLTAFFLTPLIAFRDIFLLSFIPGLLAVLVITIGIKEGTKKHREKIKGLIGNIRALPKGFRLFLFIMFVFGIGNFNRTLLLLRAQEILTPVNGIIIAGSMAVLFYTIRNIAQAIADYSIGALSDKVGKKILLAFLGFFLFGIMSLGFVFATTNLFYFIFLFVLSGISAATYTALEKAYAADLLPSNIRGTGYGVLHTIDGIGDFISSFVVGSLWVIVSPTAAFVYGAILSFIATFLLLSLTKM
ncbi:MAG: MFS transporter [Candidatus Aenigmatarchaeota archaeon]